MRRLALLWAFCWAATLAMAGNAPAAENGSNPVAPAFGPVKHGAALRTLALRGNRGALQRLTARDAVCAGADNGSAGIGAQEQAMRCMVNFARQQAGLPQLSGSGQLANSAGNKAGDILRCNQFSHEACGRDFLYWFRRAGYLNGRCWWAGENLAWGTGSLGTARSIFNAWMRSPAHRANILSGQFNQFGISLQFGSLLGRPGAHVWVNHFGRHC